MGGCTTSTAESLPASMNWPAMRCGRWRSTAAAGGRSSRGESCGGARRETAGRWPPRCRGGRRRAWPRARLEVDSSFDAAEGREAWHTPWGAPADVRSISSGADGAVYVNVHVGGVLRSTDGGAGWRPTLDIEHDVHQVLALPERPGLVLVAAADGFGLSRDGGDT